MQMLSIIRKRSVSSLISLIDLIVLVFFLSRLTEDPAALFLPVESFGGKKKQQVRELHVLEYPLII
jgi:peptide/nickel transport system permease protein